MRNFVIKIFIFLLVLAIAVLLDQTYLSEYRLLGPSLVQHIFWVISVAIIIFVVTALFAAFAMFGSSYYFDFLFQVNLTVLLFVGLTLILGTILPQIIASFLFAILIPTFTTRYILFK